MDLVMQVGSCGPATVSHEGNCLAPLDILAFLDKGLFQVGVFRQNTVTVLYNQHPSISMVPNNGGHYTI